MSAQNFVSFAGIFILMALAWALSEDRRRIPWRVMAGALALQFAAALFIFQVPAGTTAFLWINDAVVRLMDCASAGTRFLFGLLALSPGQTSEWGEKSIGFMLAFQALPTIVFFSSLLSILYYINVMPLLIRGFAYVFTRAMNISGAESLVATSNIFVGVESALTVKPFLPRMTRSELCVVLTAGMATVASNVMALYIFSLRDVFPAIAGHLVSASLLSAPAAVLMAKLLVPERERPETLGAHVHPHSEKEASLFEAIINGANAGLKMIAGIAALLLAILGLVALADLIFVSAGARLNSAFGWQIDWSLRALFGLLFYPLTLAIGIAPADAGIISRIIGERMIVTEVVSYQDLAAALSKGLLTDPRSAVIATYALCGFAHVASMAIFVGGAAALAPERTRDLTRVAPRSLIGATLACLMTACVAGTFYTSSSLLLGQ